MYLRLPNQYPYPLDQLRRDYPNTSFPAQLGAALLAEYGVYPVALTAQPAFDAATQCINELAPVQVDGVWTQQWTVRDLTPGELKARVPTVVTMRQARRALLDAGLLDQADAAIAAIADATERRQAEIDWEYATTVERLWPWVQTLGAALGLSAEDLDALFEQAATL